MGVVGVVGSGSPSLWEQGIKDPIQQGGLGSSPERQLPSGKGTEMLGRASWQPLPVAWSTVWGAGPEGQNFQGSERETQQKGPALWVRGCGQATVLVQ